VPNERMIVNNELERLWNAGSVVCFKAMSWHLPGRTEETSVRILSVSAEICNGHLPIQKCYCLNHFAWM
jgi:hypothetical protein